MSLLSSLITIFHACCPFYRGRKTSSQSTKSIRAFFAVLDAFYLQKPLRSWSSRHSGEMFLSSRSRRRWRKTKISMILPLHVGDKLISHKRGFRFSCVAESIRESLYSTWYLFPQLFVCLFFHKRQKANFFHLSSYLVTSLY